MTKSLNEQRADARHQLTKAIQDQFFSYLPLAHALSNPGINFEDGPHVRAMATAFQKVFSGEIKRLLIAIPPRHFKSFIGSVAFPAWALGKDPRLRIVCASYGDDLAREFGVKTRDLILSAEHQALFPSLQLDQTNAVHLRTSERGFRLGTSVGGALTGKGADIVIIDDPLKADDGMCSSRLRDRAFEWLTNTVMSRFDKPRDGRMVVIMQRLHQDDVIGRLLEMGGWDYLELPAKADRNILLDVGGCAPETLSAGSLLFPARFGETELAQKRLELGTRAYSAQFLQKPVPDEGICIDLSCFPRFSPEELPRRFDAIIQSWDTASSVDKDRNYSVCTTWGVADRKFYLLDVFRGRLGIMALIEKAKELKEVHRASWAVVEAGNGTPMVQELKAQGCRWLHSTSPTMSKTERFHGQALKLEQGRVHLPREAGWLVEFENELSRFPNGRHDDQVDAMVQFLRLEDQPGARFMFRPGAAPTGTRSTGYLVARTRRSIERRSIPRRSLWPEIVRDPEMDE